MIAPASFRVRVRSLLTGTALAWASLVGAQETGSPAPTLAFPTQPTDWIGSPPLTLEMLKGKAALLWFYEEGCPKCREKWPAMLASSRKFEGKPILFIAVNSGNSRQEVQSYVRDCNVSWPTIVDSDRSFEKAAGVNEVSLQNIYQMRLLLPDGKLIQGNPGEFEAMADSAVRDAKWNVDPTSIPASLRNAWQAVEVGAFVSASVVLKKSLKSGPPDVKAGAEVLMAAVNAALDKQLKAAESASESGSKWAAYKEFQSLVATFKGYDLPPSVAEQIKTLSTDPAVKAELAAIKVLDGLKKNFSNTSVTVRNRTVAGLQKLVADQPETDAGKEAKAILEKVGQQ